MSDKQRLLVVEDETTLRETLLYNLKREGYDVVTSGDGGEALEMAREQKFDLIVLDVMLPSLDGLSIVRILRKEQRTPIVLLTARSGEVDRIMGLETGADDYIVKPFSLGEFLARVRAVLRRSEGGPATELVRAGALSLDRTRYRAGLRAADGGEREVTLTPTEFEILAALAAQPGRVFSRAQLLSVARGVSFESYERAIDSHIRNLRRKLEPVDCIITVHGVGYKFVEN